MKEKIEDILRTNAIVLFMKGTPEQPFCGFSSTAVKVLHALESPFYAVNILEDEELRQSVKKFANWPTFPMLFVQSALVGGVDIMVELYNSGDLGKLLSDFK